MTTGRLTCANEVFIVQYHALQFIFNELRTIPPEIHLENRSGESTLEITPEFVCIMI